MFRVAQGTLSASATGTADFTVSGFGTVAGALVFVNRSNATNNPETGSGSSWMCTGFFDGTNQVCYTHHSEHGLSTPPPSRTTDCWHMYSNNKIAMWCDNGGTIQFAATAATITDGIRITTNTSDSTAYQCVVVLIPDSGVTNIEARVVDQSAIDSSGIVEVTDLGFESDLVFVLGGQASANETVEVDFTYSFGIAVNDGADTNHCINLLEDDGRALNSTTTYLSNVSNNVHCALRNTNGGIRWGLQITGFDANGFTTTKYNEYVSPSTPDTNTDDILALCIQFSGTTDVDLYMATAPTSTGNWAETNPGFTPEFGLVLGAEGVTDITSGDATDAESFSIIPFDSTTQRSIGFCSADDVSTTVGSTYNLSGWRQVEDAGVPGTNDTFVGTFSSFDANGFTWNFTAVPTTADRWPILTIGANASTSPTYRKYYTKPKNKLKNKPIRAQGFWGVSNDNLIRYNFDRITALPLTMMAWVKHLSPTDGSDCVLQLNQTGQSSYLRLGLGDAGSQRLRIREGGGNESFVATDIQINEWHHLLGTATADRFLAYLDGRPGTPDTTGTPFSLPITPDNVSIGYEGDSSPGDSWHGNIIWPAMWDAELTEQECMALARGAHPTKIRPYNLVFFAPLDGTRDSLVELISNDKPTATTVGTNWATPPPLIIEKQEARIIGMSAFPAPPAASTVASFFYKTPGGIFK